MLTIGSLFSGIGGLEKGLEMAGLGPVRWQVEMDPFCRAVLAKHWPDANREVADVRRAGIDNANTPPVDIICGGFPCQPFSVAGKRAGQADERHLWPEFARLVRELRPRFVVGENVPGLLTIDGGRVFGAVLGDLAALGYDAVWTTLRASDVGAPHRRERLFIVGWLADASCEGLERHGSAIGSGEAFAGACEAGNVVDPYEVRLCNAPAKRELARKRSPVASRCCAMHASGKAEPSLGREPDGLPTWLDRWPARPGEAQHDWEAPRVCGKCDNRAARLKALGNAVVPQVAAVIGTLVRRMAEEGFAQREALSA